MIDLIHRLARVWPFERGRDAFTRRVLASETLRSSFVQLPDWITTREGFQILGKDGADYTTLLLKIWGEYEPQTKQFLRRELRPGTVFLDIGANIGYFAVLAAHLLPDVEVIAFEPDADVSSRLQQSIDRAGMASRVKVARMAVSDTAGMVTFQIDAANSGHSRLGSTQGNRTVEVPSIILDDWLPDQLGSKQVSVIKLDVEGAEAMALRGMSQVLARHRPAIIIEAYDSQLREFGSSLAEVEAWLATAGYAEVAPRDGNMYLKHTSAL